MAFQFNLLSQINVSKALYGLTFKILAPLTLSTNHDYVWKPEYFETWSGEEAHHLLAHISNAHP